MKIKPDDIGKLINHPDYPQWGPGKIVKVLEEWAYIRFKKLSSHEGRQFHIAENPLVLAENQKWLRDYQIDLYQKVLNLKNEGIQSVLLQAPTGSGKTAIMSYLAKEAETNNKTTWFIVHRRELIEQSVRAFAEEGIEAGVISSGWDENVKAKTQICSIQSLKSRIENYKKPDFICFDECHHVPADSWKKIYNAFPNVFILGLTATPERLDGQGLSEYFEKMVLSPTIRELTDQGYLAPYRLFARGGIDLTGVRIVGGDYEINGLAKAVDKPVITGSAIKEYSKLTQGKRAVVFCASIQHSKNVVGQFMSAGIIAEHVDGKTPLSERDAAINRFSSGKTLVLSNVDLFGEGFDLPEIEVAILLRPTQSLGLYLQQVGRSLRLPEGKTEAIILDHAGNCERHGLPDDEREWTLEGREKNDLPNQKTTVRICPECSSAQNFGRPECKNCGFVFPLNPRQVKQVEGELVQVAGVFKQLYEKTVALVRREGRVSKFWKGWVEKKTLFYNFGQLGTDGFGFKADFESHDIAVETLKFIVTEYKKMGYVMVDHFSIKLSSASYRKQNLRQQKKTRDDLAEENRLWREITRRTNIKQQKCSKKDFSLANRREESLAKNQLRVSKIFRGREGKRLFEVASELGLTSQELLARCRKLGFAVPSQLTVIDKKIETTIRNDIKLSSWDQK